MGYKAMLFDLDDTLLNRDMAVDKLFLFVLENCYEDVSDTVKTICYGNLKEYDKREYGMSDKTIVLESLFDEFRRSIDCHAIISKIFGIIISLNVFNRQKYYSFLTSYKEPL